MNRKVTLRKLAEELEVSPATVLRALAGHPSVLPDLRKRIVRLAAKRGYRLPGHRTGNVAIVFAGMPLHGYLGLVICYVHSELIQAGFHPYIIAESEMGSINEYMFDGLISTTWIAGFEKKFPKEHTLPMVSLNTLDNSLDNVHMVASDDARGMTQGLSYLYKAGCRRIAFLLGTVERNMGTNERMEAFQQFCCGYNLPGEELLFRKGQKCAFSEVIQEILDAEVDAIFCASEGLALEVYSQLHKQGKRIPEDISVLGLESDGITEFLIPGLTALRQDFTALAKESVQMLKKLINGEQVTANIKVPFQFIERNSVRHQ